MIFLKTLTFYYFHINLIFLIQHKCFSLWCWLLVFFIIVDIVFNSIIICFIFHIVLHIIYLIPELTLFHNRNKLHLKHRHAQLSFLAHVWVSGPLSGVSWGWQMQLGRCGLVELKPTGMKTSPSSWTWTCFLIPRNIKLTDSHRKIRKVYGQNVIVYSMVRRGVLSFKEKC